MNQSLSFEEVSKLSRMVALLSIVQNVQMETFGQWVMRTFYPEEVAELLPNGRDFCGAERTSDARLYLVGLLNAGYLSAEPLQRFVTEKSAEYNRLEDARVEAELKQLALENPRIRTLLKEFIPAQA